jgi:very-short-patch-repair endonuclease
MLSNVSKTNGTWCPYCSNPPRELCKDNNCQICYEKSFASHEKSKFWSSKNEKTPRETFKKSHNKYIFDCDKCSHDFYSILSDITRQDTRSTWCPKCMNKTELKLFTHLQPFFPNIEIQFRADWCVNHLTGCHLPFDFVLFGEKIIIELDGPQHFIQISNWQDPKTQFEKDEYKQHCANEHGFSVIRLLQEDVFYDRYDWLQELVNTVHVVMSSDTIENVYLCQNQEYSKFQRDQL